MRNIAILLLLLSLSGCCAIQRGIGFTPTYVAPSLTMELVESNGWILHTPTEQWIRRGQMELLPQYFPNKALAYGSGIFSILSQNYFGATYTLNESEELALAVAFPRAFHIHKTVYGTGQCAQDSFADNSKSCINWQYQQIIVALNCADVHFDNTSVYLRTKRMKISGKEAKDHPYYANKGEIITPTKYNPSLKEVIDAKQPSGKRGLDYSTFYFLFENMTCTDLENAIFVVDGLYHQGKQLPPLKVRLNYLDFSQVPEYVGNQARSE